ncbi:methylated-DNA--[protein]-cysteine S-methyltransferase [Brevibacillus halotolerans]|uniref:methylated-DNA--[protein]-cysteine S-methyltransferase n=1 Tax=Brevibacillus halotolerans TaxID=1507437 RepID=UPI0015EEA350|nr:methylated-DNA--[protein]-cysteine S-methyltransferase [Brevibacillus halotolerans]MBA4535178.1 methylated-DNA--[protein]-cysteine S-methyltransferase [Brevibacillus halotolerans]
MNVLYYSYMDAPIGGLILVTNQIGVCYIQFGQDEESMLAIQSWAKKWQYTLADRPTPEKHHELHQQLRDYFQGKRKTFTFPIDLHGTVFQKKVWNALLTIPYGETRSYKEIACFIGSDKAVRAVGGANNKNPVSLLVPCHRVIGADGSLVGYGGGLSIKEQLLSLEGVLPIDK